MGHNLLTFLYLFGSQYHDIKASEMYLNISGNIAYVFGRVSLSYWSVLGFQEYFLYCEWISLPI